MNYSKIEQRFINNNKAIERNGLIIMNHNNSIEFIQECKILEIKIYGVDSFEFLENGHLIRPIIEHSVNYGDKEFQNIDIYSHSIEFLKAQPKHFWFEVVIG